MGDLMENDLDLQYTCTVPDLEYTCTEPDLLYTCTDPDLEYTCTLSPATEKKARSELNEIASTRLNVVKELRAWIEAQPHISFPKTETHTLLLFLRACKFRQEKARCMVEEYLKLRITAPHWFSDLDSRDPNMLELLDRGYVYPLPDRTEDGCSVLIYRLGAMDPACHGYRDMVRTSMTVSTLLGREEETHVNGIVMVFDFSEFSMAHMRALLDRKAMMTWNKMWQKSMPVRIKALHYYKAGFFFRLLMAFSRPFLPKKVQERIKLHDSVTSLHKHLSPELLPDEYQEPDCAGNTAGPERDIIESVKTKLHDPTFHSELLYFTSGAFAIDESLKPKMDKT